MTRGPGPWGQPGRQAERWHCPGPEEEGTRERPKEKPAGQRPGCQVTLVPPGQASMVPWQDREGLLREEGESPGSGDKLRPREVQWE